MKTIPLTKGMMAIVDDRDYDAVSKRKWCVLETKSGLYAVRWKSGGGLILMHQWIMGVSGKKQVDHKNHNGLDNRRGNLRTATATQNMGNTRARKHSSKYKGVYWDKQRGKWKSKIGFLNKTIWIGRFDSETDAAMAYNQKAVELFGDFALVNNIKT